MGLKSFGSDHHHHYSSYKLQDFLSRLEEERLKIDAFKPMEASRQQLEAHRGNEGSSSSRAPVILEEFIPLKHDSTTYDNHENSSSLCDNNNNKANWMTSAQLWSQTSHEEEEEEEEEEESKTRKEGETNGFNNVSPNKRNISSSNGGGAFLPFSKELGIRSSSNSSSLPKLSLINASSDEKEMEDKKNCTHDDNPKKEKESSKTTSTTTTTTTTSTSAATQAHRKTRRCWSPDLHRRFVNALQMLGGSQVATPKQIRELMKVDGLTNDEVKSHLQKYRLHTRRPSPSPQGVGGPTPQLVVLGGIWVPPEYAAATVAHTGAANALFNFNPQSSHAPPQHYCTTTPVPQDFYTNTLPQPPHSHALHHGLQMYKTTSHTQRSPESKARGMGERSESIEEEGKSESSY
ncbi:Myb family transcription factor EFM [Senna tora]|uniref:Myb family transcription factor EFM n=1 Tax=Senna tora TaxID=362788 RepID=A0A835CEM6_9FABA|nr:Myb family transcription factor EFM [Senna tora]